MGASVDISLRHSSPPTLSALPCCTSVLLFRCFVVCCIHGWGGLVPAPFSRQRFGIVTSVYSSLFVRGRSPQQGVGGGGEGVMTGLLCASRVQQGLGCCHVPPLAARLQNACRDNHCPSLVCLCSWLLNCRFGDRTSTRCNWSIFHMSGLLFRARASEHEGPQHRPFV